MNGLLDQIDFPRWSASTFPALLGTILPFWLYPDRFSFNWLGATEFMVATILVHAGFSILLKTANRDRFRSRNLMMGIGSLLLACLIGLHLNSMIPTKDHVPDYIFIVFGISAILTGILFIVPPISLHKRPGREVLLAEGLGFLPVLGAFLVQVGDLHRTVYLAAFTPIALTWLWVWVIELDSYWFDDNVTSNKTLVHLIGISKSTRVITPILCILPFVMITGAVITKSLPPFSLFVILLAWPAIKLAHAYYKEEIDQRISKKSIRQAAFHHGAICSVLLLSISISYLL